MNQPHSSYRKPNPAPRPLPRPRHGGLLVFLASLALILTPSHGQSTVSSARGVALVNDGLHYIQEIDLTSGAKLMSLVGDPMRSLGDGYYGNTGGGSNVAFSKRSQSSYSTELAGLDRHFSVINGQFFSLASNPTCLSFPVHSDGVWFSSGCEAPDTWPRETDRLLLEVYNNGATLGRLYSDSVRRSIATFRLVGLVAGKNLKGRGYQNQTLVGLGTYNSSSGRYQKLFLLTSRRVRESDAVAALVRRGADASKIMLMDGGGSSFLSYRNESTGRLTNAVSTSRSVPHAIAVIAAPEPTPVPAVLTERQKAEIVFRALERLYPIYFPTEQRGSSGEWSGYIYQYYNTASGNGVYFDPNPGRLLQIRINGRTSSTDRNLAWWYTWAAGR